MQKKYKRLLIALTIIYTIFTLINLGTLNFPKSVYEADEAKVIFDFGTEVSVQEIWLNENIAVGTIQFQTDDGSTTTFEQNYNGMFGWKTHSVGVTTKTIRMTKLSGDVRLNEIAFLDASGNLLAVQIQDSDENSAKLIDEQSTVPEQISYMNGMYFDEIYHARTAYEFLHNMSIYEWTHPPLGKLIISLGILIFGMCPFGWRVMPALFGAAMIPVFYYLAKKLLKRDDYAFVASALLAVDTMHFAQTRIATIDVFVVFFIMLMTIYMLKFMELDFLHEQKRKLILNLGLSGLFFGLGVCSKWTANYAAVGLAILYFAKLFTVLHKCEKENRFTFWKRAILCSLWCVFCFIILPGILYYLSYIPFYKYNNATTFKEQLSVLWTQQKGMYSYHSKLTATHSCQSAWYEWPFTARSVWFYIKTINGKISNISSGGNPGVFWVAAVGALGLAVEAVFLRLKKDSIQFKNASVAAWIMILANLLPWLGVSRCIFQYHYFPCVPFVIIAGLLFFEHLETQGTIKPKAKWIWLGVAAVYFVLLLPSASGIPTSRTYAKFIEYVLPTGNIFHGYI